MLSLFSMTWTRAGMETSVSELFLISRLFRVLLALIAAHKSSTQASVKPVISTLWQKRRQTDFHIVNCNVMTKNENVFFIFILLSTTHSSSSNRQLGCVTASQRCLTPWSPTLFKPTIRDLSWDVLLLNTEPNSWKTDWVNSHRFNL